MSNNADPRFARIAATIGDPTRALTLARLLDGRHYTAKELADHAHVTASTMSAHLKLLCDEMLIRMRMQGRHRYFCLADQDVAHALEALLRLAHSRAPSPTVTNERWKRPQMLGLRYARCCYGHLAGQLGVQLHDALIHKGWVKIRTDASAADLTPLGRQALAQLGVQLNEQKTEAGFYNCLDWSERRDHFAGVLATQLLTQLLNLGWLKREDDSRVLQLTAAGQTQLLAHILNK